MALRELTYTLLRRDFSIELDIPVDSLCPAIPNRVNYICWIEDLMSNDTNKPIRGIDMNKNWTMVATDINDRSISYATKNVARNHLEQTISVVKSTPSQIFPDILFNDNEQTYDFCMCNPPFYEDEQDIQDSLEAKEAEPSAVCRGTSNEIITTGGEVQFVKRIIDESRQRLAKIRWYTSMVGKKSSLDSITAYFKEHKILNYTLMTLRQGKTNRWAVAWSFGDEHASWASLQHVSNKMVKLSAPATALSFITQSASEHTAMDRTKELLDQLSIHYEVSDSQPGREAERGSIVIHARAKGNTWSRSARRALARAAKDPEFGGGETTSVASTVSTSKADVMGVDLRVLPGAEGEQMVEMTWTVGQDRDLFESFFLHFRNRFRVQPDKQQD
ncbi:hypothetical protein BGZ99_001311 [Dissophora globulifera]|uniref:U6 small nuclear RNA (adenine-(43)-N(6))-methyltransferase n=1 Tax=Dissophora globulifera TaxID=979702 RepID=A0A9P6RRK9_9FUNG|nr:hypothetical protein BGZ99_001311 [Dissophora globulifera]